MAERRQRLGLSRQDVADRAGMAVGFVEYVESSAGPPDIVPLTRLAGALGTSAWELLGGGVDIPPGRAAAAAHPVLEELPAWECWARLAPGGIGRVALATEEGPVVLPVNFRVLDGTVVYRTAAGSTPAAAVGDWVAFEVDHIDEAQRSGWSVLVKGTAALLDDPDAVEHLTRRGSPDPWAGGARDVWVRVKPSSITGRRIRISDTPTSASGT
ncbi:MULTISPECIES: pyridoxamine 5'-phosphate oxidase family protein [unclassified Kitasatospora]|uniref:helix-turn-helix domain-containing protein n=1 Tax=unclassified Kitasatospora TaxID=2633591 RepID=UPI0033F4019F